MRDGFHFLHDVADDRTYSRIAHHLDDGSASEGADRIERGVAQNFDPNLVPQAAADRATEARGDERFGDGANAIGARPIGLAEGNAIAFDVLDDAG